MRVSMLVVLFAFSQILVAEEKTDLAVIHQIKKEAFENSKVMDHLFYLVDCLRTAADWLTRISGGSRLVR